MSQLGLHPRCSALESKCGARSQAHGWGQDDRTQARGTWLDSRKSGVLPLTSGILLLSSKTDEKIVEFSVWDIWKQRGELLTQWIPVPDLGAWLCLQRAQEPEGIRDSPVPWRAWLRLR